MHAPFRTFLFGVTLALGLPSVAHADTFVLAPLQGRNPKACANVTDLLSAELDFQPAVSEVVQGTTPPSGTACLASTTCLWSLMHAGGGEQLVTGVLHTTSDSYTMDLVYYDGHTIVRRQSFTLKADATALADGMTGVVRALLLGKTPEEEKAAQPVADDFDVSSSSSDDFKFDDSPKKSAAARKKAEEDARAEAEADERAKAQAQEKAEEDAQRRAADEKRRRDEEARRAEQERHQHEEEVAQQKAAPVEFDPNSITFASASSDIKIEAADPVSRSDAVASADDDSLDVDDSSARRRSSSRSGTDDLVDIDAPSKSKSKSKPKHERDASDASHATARTPKPTDESHHILNIVARGGYSPYYKLGFLTYGVEVAVPIAKTGVYVGAGVQAWSVHRVLPPEVANQVGQSRAWDSIFPLNIGAVYKFGHGTVMPYAGADVILAQYYVDKQAGKRYWAVGPRARVGADLYLSRLFGLTVDGSLGFWGGKQWEVIDSGVKNSGFLPQISAGAVFRL